MLRDELALKSALAEELTYEAQPADLAQLQALWSGEARQLLYIPMPRRPRTCHVSTQHMR